MEAKQNKDMLTKQGDLLNKYLENAWMSLPGGRTDKLCRCGSALSAS